MEEGEISRLTREYDRNLTWCRFWLGISLAVATLTFTFGVDRLIDDRNVDQDTVPIRDNVKLDEVKPDVVKPSEVFVLTLLISVACVCAGLSIRFRELYTENDRLLSSIEPISQEDT